MGLITACDLTAGNAPDGPTGVGLLAPSPAAPQQPQIGPRGCVVGRAEGVQRLHRVFLQTRQVCRSVAFGLLHTEDPSSNPTPLGDNLAANPGGGTREGLGAAADGR